MSQRLPAVLVWLGVGLYLACLPMEAICIEGNCSAWPAFGILMSGWMAIGQTLANTAWLANSFLWLVWVGMLKGSRRTALVLSAAAVGLALLPLIFPSVVSGGDGGTRPITGFVAGYWLWLAACGVTLIAAVLRDRIEIAAVLDEADG